MKSRKWAIVGATSALGFGLVAGGAVLTANALTIEDTRGAQIGDEIRLTKDSGSQTGTSPTPDAASAVGSPGTEGSASTPSATPSPNPPAAPAPQSVSVVSPASPVSVASPASIDSPGSVPSAD